MKITGLDSLIDELETIGDNAKSMAGTHSVNLSDAFNESFMTKHTNFKDFMSFLEAGGFKAESQEEFDAIDTAKLDKYVSSNTTFDSFEDMLGNATMPLIKEELFRNL